MNKKIDQIKEAQHRLKLYSELYGVVTPDAVEAYKQWGDIPVLDDCAIKGWHVLNGTWDGAVNHINKIMKEYGGVPYLILADEVLVTVLYVTKNSEEWSMDIEDLKEGYSLAYVYNVTDEICSEFGYVQLKKND